MPTKKPKHKPLQPMYVEELPTKCEHPGCGCGGPMYMHGKCHIDAPTWTVIEGEVARVICAECDRPIVSLWLAHRPTPPTVN